MLLGAEDIAVAGGPGVDGSCEGGLDRVCLIEKIEVGHPVNENAIMDFPQIFGAYGAKFSKYNWSSARSVWFSGVAREEEAQTVRERIEPKIRDAGPALISFDKLQHVAELFGIRSGQNLIHRHFAARHYRAGLFHLPQPRLMILLLPGAACVGDDMHLVSAFDPIQDRLLDADMGFDPADYQLL